MPRTSVAAIRLALRDREPIIGMVHLRPLPGSPRWGGSLDEVCDLAVRDAAVLAGEGVAGLLVENFGDAPFLPLSSPPETIAAMAVVMDRLRCEVKGELIWGVNILRNDAASSLAVAAVCRAALIRINVHLGTTATDQGWIEGRAHETLRRRAALGADVAILADVSVKHGRSFAYESPQDEAADLLERGLADGLLVTGSRTGSAPDLREVEIVSRAAGLEGLVLVASGISEDNVGMFLPHCHGVIVGTSLKHSGRVQSPVDPDRVRALIRAIRSARKKEE